jgi:hypothetical protein
MPSIAVKMCGAPRAGFAKPARGTVTSRRRSRRSWLLGKPAAGSSTRSYHILAGEDALMMLGTGLGFLERQNMVAFHSRFLTMTTTEQRDHYQNYQQIVRCHGRCGAKRPCLTIIEYMYHTFHV